jgi:hypothetical protein
MPGYPKRLECFSIPRFTSAKHRMQRDTRVKSSSQSLEIFQNVAKGDATGPDRLLASGWQGGIAGDLAMIPGPGKTLGKYTAMELCRALRLRFPIRELRAGLLLAL